MNKIKSISIIVSLIALVISSGCMKDEIKLNDPKDYNRPLNMAAPIFNAHFSAKDLLERIGDSSLIYTDADGLLHAQSDTNFILTYEDVIHIDSMELYGIYDISSSNLFRDTIPVSKDSDQTYDSIHIELAQMQVIVTEPTGFVGDYTITFPEIKDSYGAILQFNKASSGGTQDLAGGKIYFFQIPTNSRSGFEIITQIFPTSTINSGDMLVVDIKMLNFKPDVVWGFFGSRNVNSINDTIDFDFTSQFNLTDMIQFRDVKMTLTTESYFGIPVSLFIEDMVFENTETGDRESVDKLAAIIPAVNYKLPLEPQSSTDAIQLEDAVNIAPDKMYFDIARWINHPENTSKSNFLVNDGGTTLNTSVDINVPFWFKTTLYQRTDTIGFDVREMFDSTTIDYLDELNLYFEFDNGFPFNIYSQAYVTDSLGTVLDSLIVGNDPLLWKSPVIDANGKATGTENTEIIFSLKHDQVYKLYEKHATQILLVSRIQTGGLAGTPDTPEFVKLYEDYTIDISMSIDIKSKEIQ